MYVCILYVVSSQLEIIDEKDVQCNLAKTRKIEAFSTTIELRMFPVSRLFSKRYHLGQGLRERSYVVHLT